MSRNLETLPLYRVSEQDWWAFLQGLPFYSFFHTPLWYRAHEVGKWGYRTLTLSGTAGAEPFLLPLAVAHRGPFQILYSGPRGGYGGFLTPRLPPSPRQMAQILRDLITPRVLALHLVGHPLDTFLVEGLRELSAWGFSVRPFRTFVVLLPPDFDRYFRSLDDKTRSVYRRPLKVGAGISWDKEWAPAFHRLSRRVLGRENYPLSFLRFLLRHPEAQLLSLLQGDRYLGGALFLLGKGEVFYLMGAYDPAYRKLSPLTHLLIEGIRSFIAEGFRVVNLGASGGLRGVEHFKRNFGAEAREGVSVHWESTFYRRVFLPLKRLIRRLPTPPAPASGHGDG